MLLYTYYIRQSFIVDLTTHYEINFRSAFHHICSIVSHGGPKDVKDFNSIVAKVRHYHEEDCTIIGGDNEGDTTSMIKKKISKMSSYEGQPIVVIMLQILEAYRLKFAEEGDYLKAGDITGRIKRLSNEEVGMQEQIISAKQSQDKIHLKQTHDRQQSDFVQGPY